MIEKRNVPERRFPEFEVRWKDATLGSFFKNLRTGMTPSRGKPQYFTGDIPWITSGELNYNHITDTKERITEKAVRETGLRIYPPNTFFIAITGLEAPGTRGRCAINDVPATTNQSCMAFEQVPEIHQKFLYFWYLRNGVPLYFKFAQGTKQESFNNRIVEDFNIKLPSLPEQQKIAEFLTAVDRRIELLQAKKEKLEAYKKGVMQKIFSQRLRFKTDDGSDFPDWEEKKLGEVAKVFSGGTPSSSNSKFYGGHVPFIRSGEINSNETELWLTDEGLKNSSAKLVEKGDVLLAIYGATSGEVGISKITGAINQAILCIRWAGENAFLNAWLRLNKDTLIQKYLQGGQGNLSGEIVKSYLIPIPHSEEQKKIVKFLTRLDSNIENLNQQITHTQTWKKGLLQKMFV